MQYTDAVLSVTPAGAPIFFFNIPGAASADALLPPASVLTPLPGLIFRSPEARKLIDKFQFIEQRWGASSKMLLIFLFSTKSLGHVWIILPLRS